MAARAAGTHPPTANTQKVLRSGIFKRGNQWWMWYYDGNDNRIRQSLGTSKKSEAIAFHDRFRRDYWKSLFGDEETTTVAATKVYYFDDAAEAYLDKAEEKENKGLTKEIHRIEWLRSQLSGKELIDIDEDEIARLKKKCRELKRSHATTTRYMTLLRAILNQAKERKYLATVPKFGLGQNEYNARHRYLTEKEWSRLRKELPVHLRQVAEFALETGVRAHNVLHLEKCWVEELRRVVEYPAIEMKGKRPFTLHLSKKAMAMIEARLDDHPTLVFTYEGHEIKDAKTDAWDKACVRAGIDVVERVHQKGSHKGEKYLTTTFTFHGLRHTWASWHVMNGTTLQELMHLGGWGSLRMVQCYAHLAPSHLKSRADNFGPPKGMLDND